LLLSSYLSSPYTAHHLQLHSFPTRRSSDLATRLTDVEARLVMNHDDVRPAAGGVAGIHQRHLQPLGRDGVGFHKTVVYEIRRRQDRKSTRLNSSHRTISYAVFCLKKKITKP